MIRQKAQQLRNDGLTYREVGEQLGISAQSARSLVHRKSAHVTGEIIDVLCAGCGKPFTVVAKKGRVRKWCSEKCRKQTYAGKCQGCGAPTNGSDGRGAKASQRCIDCSKKHCSHLAKERARPYRELIERLWAEGLTEREIQAQTGRTTRIGVLRARGYDLPHRRSPEMVEMSRQHAIRMKLGHRK